MRPIRPFRAANRPVAHSARSRLDVMHKSVARGAVLNQDSPEKTGSHGESRLKSVTNSLEVRLFPRKPQAS
jgi:hypothetical protein